MRNRFEEQMNILHKELLEMGTLLEQAGNSVNIALNDKDIMQAKNAINFEVEVDQKERNIESLCLKLLLQQQPVAKDLRVVSSALKMITDMERIGDQIADIAEIVIQLIKTNHINKIKKLSKMSEATNRMLKASIDSFIKSDELLAKEVIQMDDIVDDLFITIREDIVKYIKSPENIFNDNNTSQALDFLMISKYYERIGDHIVNIAEWVVFSLTGIHKDEKPL